MGAALTRRGCPDPALLGDGAGRYDLFVPVDDPAAVEVVGRELHAHAVAREHADAEAAHLAGEVSKHLVAHVELHAEVEVLESLDDLALNFDLLFNSHGTSLVSVDRAAPGYAPVAGFSIEDLKGHRHGLAMVGRAHRRKPAPAAPSSVRGLPVSPSTPRIKGNPRCLRLHGRDALDPDLTPP